MKVVKEVPLAGTLCTGSQSSCPIPEVDAYASALEPDGETAYRVRQRLDEGQGLREIAAAMDLSWQQVLGVAQTVESPPHVLHGDHPPDVTVPQESPPSSPSGTGSITFEEA